MKERKDQKKRDSQASPWQPTQHSNLIRYVPSGTLYARFRVRGKLVWKSLKTERITVAQMRLADLEKQEREKAERGEIKTKGKILFEHARKAYEAKGYRPAVARNKKDAKVLKPAAVAYYSQRVDALLKSWEGLDKAEVRKITERDCHQWADWARNEMSASAFNHTLGVLRNIIDYGIKAGARYDNPAKAIMRESETHKTVELPDASKFDAFVAEIEGAGGGYSRPCAELVRFMAYGGLRKGEAAYVTWRDCDFAKGQITLRGPATGLKNRKAGEIRIVPMISDMRQLLTRLQQERPSAKPEHFVMEVRECQKAMDRAAKQISIKRMTHHDMRHLFATRCIESGVDIPTVSKWLGHKDGGALAMKVYGHLRDQHSTAMAQKVSFAAPQPENVVTLPKDAAGSEVQKAGSI